MKMKGIVSMVSSNQITLFLQVRKYVSVTVIHVRNFGVIISTIEESLNQARTVYRYTKNLYGIWYPVPQDLLAYQLYLGIDLRDTSLRLTFNQGPVLRFPNYED